MRASIQPGLTTRPRPGFAARARLTARGTTAKVLTISGSDSPTACQRERVRLAVIGLRARRVGLGFRFSSHWRGGRWSICLAVRSLSAARFETHFAAGSDLNSKSISKRSSNRNRNRFRARVQIRFLGENHFPRACPGVSILEIFLFPRERSISHGRPRRLQI